MNQIVRSSAIDPAYLGNEFYFQSLLDEAQQKHLISDMQISKIQTDCIKFLAYKTKRYTSGDSSSVKVELAQNILSSILYTIGIYLKTLSPDDALAALLNDTIPELYNKGRRKIDTKMRVCKHLHKIVLDSMLRTINETYNDTLIGGIKGFFKIYDADYDAHTIHITADYPLCNPVDDFVGIEFINAYLRCIIVENGFCAYFDFAIIHQMMRYYHKNYEVLIINIFEQVLTSAIGCMLTDEPVTQLLVSRSKVLELQANWMLKTKPEVEKEICDAAAILLETLNISDASLKRYIKKSLSNISSTIYLAIQTLTLDKIFVGNY